MENREIAAQFDKMADLLEFQGANPFRVRAYRNGSRRLQDLPDSIESLVTQGEDLTKLDGIGKDLAEKITQLVKTGTLQQLDELLEQVPESVLALLRIPGLGPKKAAVIYKELGIESLADLRTACQEHKVRELKGFGAKTEEGILAGIDLAERAGERIYWATADEVVQRLREYLSESKAVKQLEVAGSYRRGRETVGDLDFLVDATDTAAVMDHFGAFSDVTDTIARGDTKMSVRLASGLQVDLRVVPTKSFGAALQYFTGSKEHNVVLRGMAKDRGLKINEWGVFRVAEGEEDEYLAGKTEADVYKQMDLPCYPPELRENRGEFDYKKAKDIPKLIELDDLVGDLHMHTTASDGKQTIREMVAAAQERELRYIAITDHSKRVTMAGGLDSDRLRTQWDEVDRVNDELDDFLVLKGIECDILEKGGMDLPDDVLAEADWVIASVHYGQNQERQQITDRIIGALENPWVSVVAHPTGRLINKRERYAVDLEAVMQAAVENGKLLELNANPARLDLDDVHCSRAKQLGIPIVINSDAHSIGGLDVLRFGIKQARRAGLTAKDVANTRDWAKLKKLIRRG
ncbi:DNA polymerase/3'-5' exonuclease PolX [Aeoliella sp. ICT_H6.2]|uniref:DNA polymerase beta n=1 Tax=Aeoliella straminimaris TaxID=2954799 RepID=A0A9X2FF46_9BACT|nr:DNA polymerase/3'-5' exonuclease PolX [Aeoliella straminimaris]MCO6047880.1 DNA polymerase/3'-5' exonuclease PolX [Aeoliella straminimaris]